MLRQPNDAIAALEYNLEVAADHEDTCMNLARVYVALNETEKARHVLDRLQERIPDSAIARRALEELENR